jgi:hypothetical protein
MATLPRPKSIPEDIYNEMLVKIANDEVTKIHNELFEISNYFKNYFRLYRVFAMISTSAIVVAIYSYGESYFYGPVAVAILFGLLAKLFLWISENCINAIIIANTKKETIIYERAFSVFSDKQ